MSQLQDFDFRSEEVQEILGTPPSWMIRYGTIAVIFGLVATGILFYLVKFPDKITGNMELHTTGKIIDVNFPEDGYLDDFFCFDSLLVEEGQALAQRQADYSYVDFYNLRNEIHSLLQKRKEEAVDFFPKLNIPLGPFKNQYQKMSNNLSRYQESITSDNSLKTIGELKSLRRRREREINSYQKQYNTSTFYHNEVLKTIRRLRRNIGAEGSGTPLREAVLDSIRSSLKLQEIESKIRKAKDDIDTYKRQIASERGNKNDGNITYWEAFQQDLNLLKKDISDWEAQFIITAPIEGHIVVYNSSWKNRYFRKGEPIVGIIPVNSSPLDNDGNYTAIVTLSNEGYGKVEEEQEVILKFDSYPFRQFGVVRGIVSNKAIYAKNQQYTVEVKVPQNLITSFDNSLTPEPQMYGKAEILTKERRFIERIFAQFRSIFGNR